MKRKIIIFAAATIFASAVFLACPEKPTDTVNTITMVTSSVRSVSFDVKGSGKMTIAWDDAIAPDTIQLTDTITTYQHNYSSDRAHQITITGNVTYLYANYNSLNDLDISKTTVIQELYCGNNRLSELVAKCAVLKFLDCSDNNLSVTAFEELFGTLNSTAFSKTIEIFSNPGCESCDRSIASKKGWSVGECW
jgi:hypothetical protein